MAQISEAQLQPGEVVGHYQLVHLLDRRHAVEVWWGQHITLHIQVALKILRRDGQQVEDYRRFEYHLEQEARILSELHHKHIIGYRDYLIGRHFHALVMEYAPGGSLATHHHSGRRLPLAQVRRYVGQTGQALAELHQHGVLHRDVKPSNILLLSPNCVLLADFGLAMYSSACATSWKVSASGTPGYIAPEQQRGRPCAASDQYALAICAYLWLVGHRPFSSATERTMATRAHAVVRSVRLFRPELPAALDEILRRALHPDPAKRYPTVQDFTQSFIDVTRTARPPLIPRLPYYHTASLPMLANTENERSYDQLKVHKDLGA